MEIGANILLTPTGPVLVDWDAAGPALPWWEVVHVAFDFAMPEHTREPDRAVVHRIVTAYTNAGGTPGPAHADALAGLVHATVGWFAFNLWRCLGHRPVTPQQQRHATQVVIDGLMWLPRLVGSLDRWKTLLA